LRSFLLASLKHFMANERRDAAAIKRGGGRALIPLDGIESYDSSRVSIAATCSAPICFMIAAGPSLYSTGVFARLREESQGSANAPLLERLKHMLSDEPDRPSQSGDCA